MNDNVNRLQLCRERLAGALRALADAPHLAVSFDSTSAHLDAEGAHLPPLLELPVDWTSWRALADRLALRYRYPLPVSRTLPGKLEPLVEALWQARAESFGAYEWPGVASNMQSSALERHAAAESLSPTEGLPERLSLIAHDQLGVFEIPAAIRPAIECWRRELAVDGIHLEALAKIVEEPRRYAAMCLRIARRLGQEGSEFSSATRQRVKAITSEAQAAQGRQRHSSTGPPDTAPSFPPGSMPQSNAYRIFSRTYDETLRPSDLVGISELSQLYQRLEAVVAPQQPLVRRLTRQLERLLLAPRPASWRNLQEQGRLDPRQLHRLITAPEMTSLFRQPTTQFQPHTVVSLLLDNSASMRGRRIELVAQCADLLTRSLERCGIAVEVLGFTTVDWDGGEAAALWREAGQPSDPGRLAARRHLLFKSADQPWRRVRNGLGLMLREDMLKENLDGEALEWAARRLLALPEQRRILILLGDGVPHERATASANGEDYLRNHLQNVIHHLERHPELDLLAIGFGPSVQLSYTRAVHLRDPRELAQVLTQELAKLLAKRRLRDAPQSDVS